MALADGSAGLPSSSWSRIVTPRRDAADPNWRNEGLLIGSARTSDCAPVEAGLIKPRTWLGMLIVLLAGGGFLAFLCWAAWYLVRSW